MSTATGAPYVCFEGMYCPADEGGCGILEHKTDYLPEFFPPHGDALSCENCGHSPLAHVTIQTADQQPDGNPT